MLKSSVLEDSYASNLFEQKAVVKNSAASFRQGSCWSSSCDDKQTLKAILFVLTTGCRWADLPREYGSYATAWRRLRRWTRDGTLVRIWDVLLAELEFKGKLDLKKCHWMLVCSRKKGGQLVGRTCGGSTSKRHAVVEGNGWPLAVVLSDGRCHDITRAVAAVESSQIDCLRRRPRGLAADKGYDWVFQRYLSMRGIWHSIPERKKPKRNASFLFFRGGMQTVILLALRELRNQLVS